MTAQKMTLDENKVLSQGEDQEWVGVRIKGHFNAWVWGFSACSEDHPETTGYRNRSGKHDSTPGTVTTSVPNDQEEQSDNALTAISSLVVVDSSKSIT